MAPEPVPHPGGREPAPAPLDLVQAFVNTEIPEWGRDDLRTPPALADWLAERGLLAPGEEVEPAAFLRAHALRAALRELALAHTLGASLEPAARERVTRALAEVPLVLAPAADGSLAVEPAGRGVDAALGRLLAVVLHAERDGTWRRLKACRQDTCRWLFFDHSRNRSSSWCSMAVCGNRAKTSAYRRRRAGSGP